MEIKTKMPERENIDTIKLSVIVTCYNQAQYIDEALSSVVMQKVNFNYEILVGDDGSTDGTLEKIKIWQQKYPTLIKYFVMDREPGKKYIAIHRASANRINLITKAKGEYFAILDGDDYYCDENKLAKQVEILEDDKNIDCIGCAHGMDIISEDSKIKSHKQTRKQNSEGKISPFFYWGSGFHFSTCCFVFRNIFKPFPKDFPVLYFNDSTLTLYMLNYGNIYYLPQIMLTYRKNLGSTWATKAKDWRRINNLIIYETAKKTNIALEQATMLRYFRSIKYVYKHRRAFIKPCYDELRQQAADEKAEYALRLLMYPFMNCRDKWRVILSFYKLYFKRLVVKFKNRKKLKTRYLPD